MPDGSRRGAGRAGPGTLLGYSRRSRLQSRNITAVGRLLFIAFLLVPLAELYVLIQVGGVIGALPTVALVVFTAVLGAFLIRSQGLATVARMRAAMDRGEVPAVEILEGACLLVAGALLLTPGFVTDTVGFVLLLPMLRRSIILRLLERGFIRSTRTAPGPGTAPGQIIDGEYRRED